jgi:hypothetical protein
MDNAYNLAQNYIFTVKFSTAFNNFLLKFNLTIKSLAIPFWVRPSGFCFFGTYQKPCAHPQNLAVLIRSTAAKGKTGKQERKVIFVNPHIKFCSGWWFIFFLKSFQSIQKCLFIVNLHNNT